MKTKFNKMERVAGLFVIAAAVGSLVTAGAIAIKKGFFEKKLHLSTELKTADGVHVGTEILMAGLRAGSVTDIQLVSNERVVVNFEIAESYGQKIGATSVVRLVRPFIIGEKVLEVSVAADADVKVTENAVIQSEETMDLLDLASGRKIGTYLASMSQTLDKFGPLMKNIVGVTGEVNQAMHAVNKKQQLAHMMDNLVQMTGEVNLMLPEFRKQSPQMAKDLAQITRSVALLSAQLEKTLPLLNEVTPELPKATRRAFEALDETVVTLKALQKSFLMRGNVREVHLEELANDEKNKTHDQRLPASGGAQPAKP